MRILEFYLPGFSNFLLLIIPWEQLLDQAREDPGRSESTMNAPMIREEFETDEEFFRYHLARHGRDRSLSTLWQLFHESVPTGYTPGRRSPVP